jgi:hypothetical protein
MKIKMNMKKTFKNLGWGVLFAVLVSTGVNAQEPAKTDSAKVSVAQKGSDRNVMLNAASANAGPRNVNIGLPASVGGTTVLDNDLPRSIFFLARTAI